MTTKFSVKITSHARNDLFKIYDYIFNNLCASQGAKRIMKMIEDSINNLADYPYSAPLINDTFLAQKGFRKLVAEDYIVLYKVYDSIKSVVIHRVFNGKTDYKNIMKS